MLEKKTYHTTSDNETRTLATTIAQAILDKPSNHQKIILLEGDLGSGKTTFVKGFVRGCGIDQEITSPSFVIFKRYAIPEHTQKESGVENIYHFDLYRLEASQAPAELKLLGWESVLSKKNLILIEWAERAQALFERIPTLRIYFKHEANEHERSITTII